MQNFGNNEFRGDALRQEDTSSTKTKIYYTKPSITDLEVRYATDAARNGWGEHCYDYIHRFEAGFREHLDVRYAIATSSATGAIELGLAGLGIRPGDEVIIADINWIASVAPIAHLGATPVFVDVLPDSWCLDPEHVRAAITPKTKAILAVHLYGNVCDLDALLKLGEEHGIAVIEDSAEGIGSQWRGRRVGSLGAFGAFSFHGTKTVTTGEGGLFVTNDSVLYETVLTLSNHGRAPGEKRQFWPERVGYKFKMSNLQAAIGCAQLERIDDLIAGKRRVFKYYEAAFSDLPIRMNPEPYDTVNGFWMPTIVVNRKDFDRQAILDEFKRQNIDGRVFFWPLTMLPMFRRRPENTVSYGLFSRALNLPSYHDISEAEMDRVIEVVRREVEKLT